MTFNEAIVLEDTTLRDGEQACGIAFSRETKLKILDALIDTGITWIEGGINAMGGSESKVLREMLERTETNDVNLVGWNRGIKEDIAASLDLGFQVVHIGLPTSDIHLNDSIEKSRKWLISQASDLVKYAKDRGAFVSISAEDVGRSDIDFVEYYANCIKEAGADRLRLSDTVGILTPESYQLIIERMTSQTEIDIQCHSHNDFGLAVSNTIAGLCAGAKYFHVTVNGIGERAGMPDLAQVVMSLFLQYNIDLGIKLHKIGGLCEIVADATLTNLYPWQPIIGDNVFAHESGIHAKGMLKNSKTFEPFDPEIVGGRRRIILGKHSGKASIDDVLIRNGIHASNKELADCLEWVREIAMIKGGSISDQSLVQIYYQVSKGF